jgi:hypothetical protein
MKKHPPYHLRLNKAVDRQLLIDILRVHSQAHEKFKYHSLGGPLLEDLRIIDHFFPGIELTSLESDVETHKRQMFHQFSSNLKLINKELSQYLTNDYEPDEGDVFWLDFTKLDLRMFQIFEATLKKLAQNSILKITLHAEPPFDVSDIESKLDQGTVKNLKEVLQKEFYEKFGAVLPHPEPNIFAESNNFQNVVQKMIHRAASRALEQPGSEVVFLPLQSTYYCDQVQMISITGTICPKSGQSETKDRFASIGFADFGWGEPRKIDIPALSLKERLHLEKHLPPQRLADSGQLLLDCLGYSIDDSKKTSKDKLEQYATYYREYPNFIKAMI